MAYPGQPSVLPPRPITQPRGTNDLVNHMVNRTAQAMPALQPPVQPVVQPVAQPNAQAETEFKPPAMGQKVPLQRPGFDPALHQQMMQQQMDWRASRPTEIPGYAAMPDAEKAAAVRNWLSARPQWPGARINRPIGPQTGFAAMPPVRTPNDF